MRPAHWMVGLFLLCAGNLTQAADNLSVRSNDTDIPVARYEAPGKALLLWLPSEHGVLTSEHIAARHLAEKGLETWLPDLYGARFLPVVASSAETLPAGDVAALIHAASRTGRQVYLIATGRGAKYALEGAGLWSQKHGRKRPLAGVVLFHPNLYAKQPELGEDPAYLPITSKTRLRIHIIQGELSPWYWTLDSLRSALQQRGSMVSMETLPDIRDRFYFRDDASPAERALGEQLPELISRAIAKQKNPTSKARSTR